MLQLDRGKDCNRRRYYVGGVEPSPEARLDDLPIALFPVEEEKAHQGEKLEGCGKLRLRSVGADPLFDEAPDVLENRNVVFGRGFPPGHEKAFSVVLDVGRHIDPDTETELGKDRGDHRGR